MSEPDPESTRSASDPTVPLTRAVTSPGESRPPSSPADEADSVTASRPPSETLSRLEETRKGMPRYRMKGEIKRGGMGAILHVWDDSLSRSLAMKVMLDRGASPGGRETTPADEVLLARFLEEAQVTGQLDHPGIVPVHELGVDSEGRVFFTMKLVKGRDLKEIFDLVSKGESGWNETRALGLLLRACEAMTYAHAKGVIHRDLKPANVMVGNFGEVYVMDWGLARVVGRKDARDIRLRPEDLALSSLQTERRREREESPDSPLMTMDGHVMGTPAYMSPEQAGGDIDSVGPRSDVYSIGAMLYQLLARQMPYVPPGTRVSHRTVLAAVLAGPPTPLSSLRRDVPAELVANVEKAMARESARRYASTIELAEDLRAFLERRVVKAYETGAVAELRKWVARNRPLAATIGAAVLALVAAIVLVNDARLRADDNALEARRQRDQVLRLADVQRLKDLVEDAALLWPAHPEHVAGIEDWLARARDLAGRLGQHRESLSRLRASALPWDEVQARHDRDTHPDAPRLASLRDDRAEAAETLARLQAERLETDEDGHTPSEIREFIAEADANIARLEAETGRQRTWAFEDKNLEWQHGVMAGLDAGIESLAREDRSWTALTISALERRLEFARAVRQKTIDGEKSAWDAVIAGIRESDLYGGLEIVPQMGLVPIGTDPDSRYFEFWHVQSGERPARGDDGRIVPSEAMGIVLVLIPGGTFKMGSPESEAGRGSNEGPRHDVPLAPYFISKYEMTQGQWERFAGRNPSGYRPPQQYLEHPLTLTNPVERVSWDDCATLLAQLGLDLPTEAQWERAARGGTETAWWTGADRETLRGMANVADQAAARIGAPWQDIKDWPENDDGHVVHAPVGTFPANGFGLHEVAGNVWEWCRDWFGSYRFRADPGDGERHVRATEREARALRGGSFRDAASLARSAFRRLDTSEFRNRYLGVRPARRVTR